jgi:hypothetical protein
MSLLGNCPDASRTFFPMVYSAVTLTRAGSEWVGSASSAAAGDVELRVRQSSSTTIGNSFQVAGTMKGTAVHMPELFASPPWEARANFGTDARTTLTGVAFGAGFIGAQTGGLDGVGSGSIVLSDTAGHSCTGTTFSWSVYPRAQ